MPRKPKPPLTQERLKELVDYSPETGVFTARVTRGSAYHVGAQVGKIEKKGYIRIGIDYKQYFAHRLAWLYVYGCWPTEQLDHINRVTSDNRIGNLREATNNQNKANGKIQRNNKCGKKGVTFTRPGKWRAIITKNKRNIHLGYFATAEEAHAAYAAAAPVYFGEFARAE